MVNNALAATAVGLLLNLTMEQIAHGIKNVSSVAGRSNIVKTSKYILIDDCYNANPVSMKSAVDLLSTTKGRKVAILGDMFELGEDEAFLHKEIGKYAVKKQIDTILCTGILSKNMYDGSILANREIKKSEIRWFQTKNELLVNLADILKDGDTVLVKASHGMGFSEVVDILKKD